MRKVHAVLLYATELESTRSLNKVTDKKGCGKHRVTTVTATRLTLSYLLFIGTGQRPHPRGARAMTKFYSLMLAAMLMAPMAWATMNQAAQMVA
jgi:hypothetical protein